jgi:hypothetical protein
MKVSLFLGVCIITLGIGLNLKASEIYQWVDKDGVQHFTDGPPPPDAQVVDGLSETEPDDTRPYTGQAEREANPDVEDREINPNVPEDTGAAEGGENNATYREDYWRRQGWGDDKTGNEENGAAKGAEDRSAGSKEAGAFESSENGPAKQEVE